MGSFIPLLCLLLFFLSFSLSSSTCNRHESNCNKSINNVHFFGAHNSGSGFRGTLKYGSGLQCLSCFYKNHEMSITQQLNFGARYFDVDSTFLEGKSGSFWTPNGAWTNHADCFSGPIQFMLDEFEGWLNSNPNEIIIIHFNHDIKESKSDDRSKIAHFLESSVKAKWDTGTGVGIIKRGEERENNGEYKTLQQLINNKKRVWIWMATKLATQLNDKSWFQEAPKGVFYEDTWQSVVAFNCSQLVENAIKVCNNNLEFTVVSAFAGTGMCLWDNAKMCSSHGVTALHECNNERMKNGKIANIVIIDYFNHEGNKVLAKVDELSSSPYSPSLSSRSSSFSPRYQSPHHGLNERMKEYEPETFEEDVGGKRNITWFIYLPDNPSSSSFSQNAFASSQFIPDSASIAVDAQMYPELLEVFGLSEDELPAVITQNTFTPHNDIHSSSSHSLSTFDIVSFLMDPHDE